MRLVRKELFSFCNADIIHGLIPWLAEKGSLRELGRVAKAYTKPVLREVSKEAVIPASTSAVSGAECIKGTARYEDCNRTIFERHTHCLGFFFGIERGTWGDGMGRGLLWKREVIQEGYFRLEWDVRNKSAIGA